MLANDHRSSCVYSGLSEGMSVGFGAHDAEEGISRLHRPAIEGDAAYRYEGIPHDLVFDVREYVGTGDGHGVAPT